MKHPDNRYSDMFYGGNIARRDFVTLSVGAVVAATLRPAIGPGMRSAGLWFPDLVETNVNITTPDGVCDAVFIHPKSGAHPGVLVWPDVFGLRPAMVDIGKRLAAQGYSVLVPNPFYRIGKTPFPDASKFDFKDSMDTKQLGPLMAQGHAPGNVEKDAPGAHRVPRRTERGGHNEENRRPGLLYGWPDGGADRRRGAGPRGRGRVVPWRRAGH